MKFMIYFNLNLSRIFMSKENVLIFQDYLYLNFKILKFTNLQILKIYKYLHIFS